MKKLAVMFLTAFMMMMVLVPSASVFANTNGQSIKTEDKTTAKTPSTSGGAVDNSEISIILPKGDATILTTIVGDLKSKTITLDPQKNGGKTGVASLFAEGKGGNASFNADAFEKATPETRKIAMKEFVAAVQISGMTDQSQQRVFDTMQNSNREVNRILIPLVMDSTSADIYSAMRVMAPFLPAVRVVFGVGAIIISLLLVASTILDLVFIGLPVARESMSKGKDGGAGGSKPSFITPDAQSVINETESNVGSSGGGGYKNAYILYFKRRALTYIVLAFCLLYLVVGELGGLIGWLMSLGDGLVAGQ